MREAIAKHREEFDTNPALYWESKFETVDGVATDAASRYMNCDPGEVALTDSTTQGMAMVMNGLKLKEGRRNPEHDT